MIRLVGKIIIVLFGFGFFTILLKDTLINEWTFFLLLSLVLIVAIVFTEFDKLKELNIKELKLTLREVEEKSETIKQLSKEIVGMISINSGLQGRFGSEKSERLRVDISTIHIKRILDLIDEKGIYNADVLYFQNYLSELRETKITNKLSQREEKELSEKGFREYEKRLGEYLKTLEK
jgi:hypothetical protein